MIEKRKGMCVWMAGDAVTLRVVANSRPGTADRGAERSKDQPIGHYAVAFIALVFEPGGVPA